MIRRALTTAAIISVILLAASVSLFLMGYVFTPWNHSLSLGESLHIGVWGRGLDSRIVFFNNKEYGPYRGSIIGLARDNGDVFPPAGDNGDVFPPLKDASYWGDSWGIYYRSFYWSDASSKTLMVSLWYPIVVFSMMPFTWLLCR